MTSENDKKTGKASKTGRRDVIKTLATVPLLGAVAYGLIKARKLLSSTGISPTFSR